MEVERVEERAGPDQHGSLLNRVSSEHTVGVAGLRRTGGVYDVVGSAVRICNVDRRPLHTSWAATNNISTAVQVYELQWLREQELANLAAAAAAGQSATTAKLDSLSLALAELSVVEQRHSQARARADPVYLANPQQRPGL